ncbi:MAG: MBL fold metallo-hydrolase, partial [Planctomycetota bacterium]|nr:MBL fold metallo-hydrolase [Planctomycetota bacterium]
MRVGDYDIRGVHAGEFALDGGAMFGIVPQALWKKRNPPDEKNRIALALRSMLIRGGERTILVDTGVGKKFSEKLQEIYRIRHDRFDLEKSLRAEGVLPEDVTDVVISHLHFDHAGGATVREGETLRPTFPRATYHVQKENWEAANEAHELERRSYLPENFVPLQDAGQLQLHDGADEIAPGVELVPSTGHTPGMHLVKVQGGGEVVLFCADLIPTASHVRIPFIMAYDLYPATIVEEKKKVLSQAVDEDWTLYFYHDPV